MIARTHAAHFARTVILAVAALALTACGSKTIRGKVVSGPVIRAVSVADNDERLDRPGYGGVELTLLQTATRHSETFVRLDSTTSTPDGSFEFRVPNNRVTGGKLRLRAEGDAVFGGTSDIYPPQAGQTVLFQVRPRGGDASE